jgi:hypothetical protein
MATCEMPCGGFWRGTSATNGPTLDASVDLINFFDLSYNGPSMFVFEPLQQIIPKDPKCAADQGFSER